MILSNEDKDYIDNELNKNFNVMAKEPSEGTSVLDDATTSPSILLFGVSGPPFVRSIIRPGVVAIELNCVVFPIRPQGFIDINLLVLEE